MNLKLVSQNLPLIWAPLSSQTLPASNSASKRNECKRRQQNQQYKHRFAMLTLHYKQYTFINIHKNTMLTIFILKVTVMSHKVTLFMGTIKI